MQVTLLLFLFSISQTAAGSNATLFWASSPILSNETALILGGPDLSSVATVRLCPMNGTATGCTQSANLQSSQSSVKVTLSTLDAFSVAPCIGGVCGPPTVLLNAPKVKWTQADVESTITTPGGELRVFGEALSFAGGVCVATRDGAALNGSASVRLVPSPGGGGGGQPTLLTLTFSTCFALTARVPATTPLGTYSLEVRNGLPSCDWVPTGVTFSIQAPPTPWPSTVFPVTGPGGVWGALASAKANGGGVVYFPRGSYAFNATLTLNAIPPFTTLLGESATTVSLYWRDTDSPVRTSSLIQGSAGNFALVNLTIWVQGNFTSVVGDGGYDGLRMSGVTLFALPYYGLLDNTTHSFHSRTMPIGSGNNQGSLVAIGGRNWRVSDCEMEGGGSRGFYVQSTDLNAPTWLVQSGNGVLERSRIKGAFNTYGFESVNGVVVENNVFTGDMTTYGSFMATYFGKSTERIYFASNSVGGWHGADHELLTMDGGGGAYYGGIDSTSGDGLTLTLSKDPIFAGYYPPGYQPRLLNYTGGCVCVLSGMGQGQWRRVVSNDWGVGGTNRSWVVTHPFTLPLDATSLLSIVPFRGDIIIANNAFHDGGGIQLYAMAIATTVVDNTASRTSGFMAWGLNPHSWGYQPNFGVQFLSNTVVVGASWGGQTGGFATMTGDDANFTGHLNQGLVFRGNVGESDASFLIGGSTAEVVVEHNRVSNADVGVAVSNTTTTGVLLRGNVFENVGVEVTTFLYYAPGLQCCCNSTDLHTGVATVVKPMVSFTQCLQGSCEAPGTPDPY